MLYDALLIDRLLKDELVTQSIRPSRRRFRLARAPALSVSEPLSLTRCRAPDVHQANRSGREIKNASVNAALRGTLAPSDCGANFCHARLRAKI